MQTNSTILNASGKKIAAILLLLAVSAIGAFATLGDGKSKKEMPRKSLLSTKSSARPGSFSLQSGYSFRGNQVINLQQDRYISINTVMTYKQGNTTYVMPVKKKVSVNLTSQNKVSSATLKIKF